MPGAMDVILSLSKRGDGLTLTTAKQKDGEPAGPLALKLTKVDASPVVDDDQGRPVSLADSIRNYLREHPGVGFNELAAHALTEGGTTPGRARLQRELAAMIERGAVVLEERRRGRGHSYRLAGSGELEDL